MTAIASPVRDQYEAFPYPPRDPGRELEQLHTTLIGQLALANHALAGGRWAIGPGFHVLDAGCGMGLLRAPLKKSFPKARYVGMEYSEYLCERFGWHHGSVATWRTSQRFELVICYDVLQYLDERAAAKAIANLARWCRGVLYFSALTTEDWRDNCDQEKTDKVPGLRPGAWYRRALQKHFDPMGCGLWIKRGAPLYAWEMDKGARV